MDRFLDQDQDSPSPATARDRSTSPNISMLIYGDQKRHQLKPAVEVDSLASFQTIDNDITNVLHNANSPKMCDSSIDINSRDSPISKRANKELGSHVSILDTNEDVSNDTLEPPSAKKCKLDLTDDISLTYSPNHFLETNHISPLALSSNISSDNALAAGESLHFSQPATESVAQ